MKNKLTSIRFLWVAALVLPAFGTHAAVVLTTLHSFTGINDGAFPEAGLAQGSDGYFYGTTFSGGTNGGGYNGYGTVFKISANGSLTTLYDFDAITNSSGFPLDGANPQVGLVHGSDGNFYGTTEVGGYWYYYFYESGVKPGGGYVSFGTVFRISTNGALTTLYAFGTITNARGDAVDGANPEAGLAQGSDGNFYGTTSGGGTNGGGTVFKFSADGTLTTLYSFIAGNDGASPQGLVQGSDGNFYGTASGGGTDNSGTVFRISTNGLLTRLHSFTGGADGGYPAAGLVQGSDGNFYGTTSQGGTNGANGTVFKISTNGALTSLHSFTGGSDGGYPAAGLVQGSNGNFYGTTSGGGTNGNGTVYQISTNGVLTSLYSFTGGTDGANPQAGLVQGSDGSFYGTTYYGGRGGGGTVFRLTIGPEPPELNIIRSGANVILTWPSDTTGFTLESTLSLGAAAVWNPVSPLPVAVNGQNTVTNPITGTTKYYRLQQ